MRVIIVILIVFFAVGSSVVVGQHMENVFGPSGLLVSIPISALLGWMGGTFAWEVIDS